MKIVLNLHTPSLIKLPISLARFPLVYLFLAPSPSFLVHIYLCLFLFFKYVTCFYCLYSGSSLLKANGSLTGEKATEMIRGFHVRILLLWQAACW